MKKKDLFIVGKKKLKNINLRDKDNLEIVHFIGGG